MCTGRTCYNFDREKQCLTELYDLWESSGYGWRRITERYLTAVDVQVADMYIIQQEEGTIHQQTPGNLVCKVDAFFFLSNFILYFSSTKYQFLEP